MDLQSDSSVVQLSAFGIVGELRSELAVDEELEVVSASNDADVVPLVWANVRHGERSGDGACMCFLVFVDEQARPAIAGMFLAPGEVEIPRTENVRTDADVSEVGVIALKGALTGQVGLTADLDAGVAGARLK